MFFPHISWIQIAQAEEKRLNSYRAYRDVQEHRQPNEEDRREFYPPEERYDEYVYTPIPQQILDRSSCRTVWMRPTPKPVQIVVDEITECYKIIRALGYMPEKLEPEGMSDEMVDAAMERLNHILWSEWAGWGMQAGYEKPAEFPAMDMADKRTIIARIQKKLHEVRKDDGTVYGSA